MERKILKNKIFLYLTEFFSGMSVMAVEMGASRLLAPYFSSSEIIWTIIIGTIMIAMALGNLWGGRQADKKPNPDRLYMNILVAAVWIALIPVLGKYVIIGVSGVTALFVSNNFLIWAALFSSLIIFVFPLLLLGKVTPSLARYTVEDVSASGQIVGRLGALNTIGSIIGTFLPTFVTIPSVGTSITFLIFGGILLALCLVYFISLRIKPVKAAVSVAVFILCCVFGSSSSFAFWEDDLLYESESVYNYLQVSETSDSIILSTNVLFGVQSIMMKDDGPTGMYYDYALAAALLAGADEESEMDVLILGLGTGTYANMCLKYFPNFSITGVEIDEDITELAYEYFDLSPEVNAITYDGRAYLDASDETWDIIMVDAYQDITIPFQMSSVEFFTMVYEHLNENGVMIVNMNMYSESANSINDALSDTIASVFGTVYTVDVKGSTNCELFACKSVSALENLQNGISRTEDEELLSMLELTLSGITEYEAGDYILTDDKAPVELLGMAAIDEIITDELDYYLGIYDEYGLSGLLERLMN